MLTSPFAFITFGIFGLILIGMSIVFFNHLASLDAQYEAEKSFWSGSVVVRVCRDGSRVYRLKDGSHYVGKGWASQYAIGPDICETTR
jgi:hypothetical protein